MPGHPASTTRSLLLALVVLSLAALGGAATTNVTTTTSSGATNTTDATVSLSFCALCRDRGLCDHAYLNSTGVFCGSSGECCCASSAECPLVRSAANHECTCRRSSSSPPPSSTAPARIGIFSVHKIGWTVMAMAVLAALFAMYMYTTRLDRKYHYREPRGHALTPTTTPSSRYEPPRIPESAPLTRTQPIDASADSKSSRQ